MVRIIHKKRVTSTMDCAREHLPSTPEDFIILAEAQTQGRGRQGRVWETYQGNLFMTLATPNFLDLKNIGHVSLLAGLALYTSFSESVKKHLSLKWPNDLLYNMKKVGGVLIEIEGDYLLLGIGANLQSAPAYATSLKEHNITPQEVTTNFYQSFCALRNIYLQEGFETIRKQWLEHAAFQNQDLQVHAPDGEYIRGTFETVDKTGALVLKCPNQTKITIGCGEITFDKK